MTPACGHLGREGGRVRQARVGDGRGIIVPGLGEAEVEDLDLSLRRDHEVGGLEIAVDDALLVGGFEGRGDLQWLEGGLHRRGSSPGRAGRTGPRRRRAP